MLMQQRLSLKLAQKPVLTQSLRQLVKLLALNKLELKEEIAQELVENPLLETTVDGEGSIDEASAQEDASVADEQAEPGQAKSKDETAPLDGTGEAGSGTDSIAKEEAAPSADDNSSDPFDEIDFHSFFDDYLDAGHHTPFGFEVVERPSFETFLAKQTTLTDHLLWQLSLSHASGRLAETAESIIGNLSEDGYLTATLEEIATGTVVSEDQAVEALRLVQEFDPLGVAARDLKECLWIQLCGCDADKGVAGQIVTEHWKELQDGRLTEIARVMGRPLSHVEIAVHLIKHLDPRPGEHYAVSRTRAVEPDVFFVKTQEGFRVVLNEEDLPELRLNRQYRRLLGKGRASKEVRGYIRDRYSSAMQLIRNIQQRRHTILSVGESIVGRQEAFLAYGLDHLKPMMIKEVAEEIGVHPSTVSRAVANKYAHTPHGVYELRFFFSEAVQGPAGSSIPLMLLKRKVKKMISEEDSGTPLTDDRISQLLKEEGIFVTRRTVAKYREDMHIPSTHRRRRRN